MKVEVAVLGFLVPSSPYGLCGRKATLNLKNASKGFDGQPNHLVVSRVCDGQKVTNSQQCPMFLGRHSLLGRG